MMVMMIVTPMIIASRMTMVLGTMMLIVMMPTVTTMIFTMLVTKTPIVWSVEKKTMFTCLHLVTGVQGLLTVP